MVIAAVHPAWCAGKSPEKVRIAVSSKSLGFLDVWAARERGFYRKPAIEAEIIAMRSPLTIGDMATVGIGTSTRKIQQEREQVKKMVRMQLDTLDQNTKGRNRLAPSEIVRLGARCRCRSHAIYSRLIFENAKPLADTSEPFSSSRANLICR